MTPRVVSAGGTVPAYQWRMLRFIATHWRSLPSALSLTSERQSQPELNLSRVGGGGRAAEARVRRRASPERRVRQLEIYAVEHVEAFRDHFQSHSLGEANAAAQSQGARGGMKAFARVATYADRAVVDVSIVVAIRAGHNVERQGRAVPADRTQFKSAEDRR